MDTFMNGYPIPFTLQAETMVSDCYGFVERD